MHFIDGRSPRGERGLKCVLDEMQAAQQSSLPTRGAWIEMAEQSAEKKYFSVAPHAGSVD